jgi:hypothetical protein
MRGMKCIYSGGLQPGVRADTSYGVCKTEEKILRRNELNNQGHFRLSHRRPGRKDIRVTGQNRINN